MFLLRILHYRQKGKLNILIVDSNHQIDWGIDVRIPQHHVRFVLIDNQGLSPCVLSLLILPTS